MPPSASPGALATRRIGAERTRHAAGQFHRVHQLFLHRCITAYARHGRHASLRARTLRCARFAHGLLHDEVAVEERIGPSAAPASRCSSTSTVRCPAVLRGSCASRRHRHPRRARSCRRRRRSRAPSACACAPSSGRSLAVPPSFAAQARAPAERSCVRPSAAPSATRSPNAPTIRPSIVRAPATLICWPMTARTASSNPSHVPGTRKARVRRRQRAEPRGDRLGIATEVERVPHAREDRRNDTRKMNADTVSRSAFRRGDFVTVMKPAQRSLPRSIASVREYCRASTHSTPFTARAPEEAEQRVPVVRRPVRELEAHRRRQRRRRGVLAQTGTAACDSARGSAR